jgi:hypothetical protein
MNAEVRTAFTTLISFSHGCSPLSLSFLFLIFKIFSSSSLTPTPFPLSPPMETYEYIIFMGERTGLSPFPLFTLWRLETAGLLLEFLAVYSAFLPLHKRSLWTLL